MATPDLEHKKVDGAKPSRHPNDKVADSDIQHVPPGRRSEPQKEADRKKSGQGGTT